MYQQDRVGLVARGEEIDDRVGGSRMLVGQIARGWSHRSRIPSGVNRVRV
jgi:hypothetical protein